MVTLLGCDFSCSPSPRKHIVLAYGQLEKSRVQLLKIERFSSLSAWQDALQAQTQWVGGFDLPFGLPRELVETLKWPRTWRECMEWYASLSREQIRTEFKAFCDARPAGSKFAHRATDGIAGSSSSMKWVNPPVAYMMHAGVPALLKLGVYFPGLDGDTTLKPARVALEAYPGMLAREVLGRTSYKSDDKSKHTAERLIARKDLVNALELGQTRLNLRLRLSHAQRDALVADASGDALDAVLCLVQAAWAQTQYANGHANYGLPSTMDALEGWIVSA